MIDSRLSHCCYLAHIIPGKTHLSGQCFFAQQMGTIINAMGQTPLMDPAMIIFPIKVRHYIKIIAPGTAGFLSRDHQIRQPF